MRHTSENKSKTEYKLFGGGQNLQLLKTQEEQEEQVKNLGGTGSGQPISQTPDETGTFSALVGTP